MFNGIPPPLRSSSRVAQYPSQDRLHEYRQKLIDAGIEVSDIIRQTDQDGESITSFYFRDPDGIILEFSAWAEPLAPREPTFTPARAHEAPARRRDGIPHTV